MKTRKAGVIALSTILSLSVLAACGEKEKSTSGTTTPTSKETAAAAKVLAPATLKIMLPGTKPTDFDEVLAEAEKRMAGTLNVKLNVTFVPWADLKQKLQLTLASGEDYDLIWDNMDNGLLTKVQSGFYEPLEALLDQYGPNIKKNRPQEQWDANKINGKINLIPLETDFYKSRGYLIRGDLREKYGVAPIKTYDELIAFSRTLKEKEKDLIPMAINGGSTAAIHKLFFEPGNIRPVPVAGMNQVLLYYKGNDGKINNLFETNEAAIMDSFKQSRKLYTDGIMHPDIMGVKSPRDLVIQGKVGITHSDDWTVNSANQATLQKNVPGAKLEYVSFFDMTSKKVSSFTAGNFIAVPKASKNKERAIQFLDWANQKGNFDLLAYGTQGKHWEPIGDDKYKNGTGAAGYGWFPWAWIGNPVMDRISSDQSELSVALTKWSRNAANFEKDVLTGLTFDITPIANELAQLNTFIEQYHKPLSAGVADDKVFAEMKSKAEPVVKKIQTELQKQADAFRKK